MLKFKGLQKYLVASRFKDWFVIYYLYRLRVNGNPTGGNKFVTCKIMPKS